MGFILSKRGCLNCEDGTIQKSCRRIKRGTRDSLKDELFGEDGVLPLPGVRFSHLDAVQVDVTVGAVKILHWQLVGLLHIQHQAAHLREDKVKKQSTHGTHVCIT